MRTALVLGLNFVYKRNYCITKLSEYWKCTGLRLGYNSFFVAGNDRRCRDLLRRLLRNPPNNTKIAINIGLSKARYLCQEGFKLVGKEVRTCKEGNWIENVENKCLRKFTLFTCNTTIFRVSRKFNMLFFLYLSSGNYINWTQWQRTYWSIKRGNHHPV